LKIISIFTTIFISFTYTALAANLEKDLSVKIIDSLGNTYEIHQIIANSKAPPVPGLSLKVRPMLLCLEDPQENFVYWIQMPLIQEIVIEDKDIYKVSLRDNTEFLGKLSGSLEGSSEIGATTLLLDKDIQKIQFTGGSELKEPIGEAKSNKNELLSGSLSINNKKFQLQTVAFSGLESIFGKSEKNIEIFKFLRGPSKTTIPLIDISEILFTGNKQLSVPEVIIKMSNSGKKYRGGLSFSIYSPKLVGKTFFGAISIPLSGYVSDKLKDIKIELGKLVSRSRLFVKTNPEDAIIKILNIKPEFYQGIELDPGKYQVSISAEGFNEKKQWINIGVGENKYLNAYLSNIVPIKRQAYAVIIGISNYLNSGSNGLSNLAFADDDAKSFAAFLRKKGWSNSHVNILTNEKATRENILIALESWLTKAGPNDLIVLFWSGHGYHDPDDPEKVYFACYDTKVSIPATGYRMDRVRNIIEERYTKNVVILADTCHAGKIITKGDQNLSIRPYIDKLKREKKIPKGWIFMVGADTDRVAIEHSSWSNGAFTHCLLKGLMGGADGYESVGPQDNVVIMGELRAFMESVMPEETQRILGVAKRPVITTSTGDPDIWELSLQKID
jgi:hypothetical protein